MGTESDFYGDAECLLYRVLELNPGMATQVGDHRWDDRLPVFAPEALENQNEELRIALSDFEAIDAGSFSLDARIDHTVVVQILKSFVRQYEKVQRHRRDPGSYLDEVMGSILMLVIKEFAPLPERLRSALGRVRETPRVLVEARGNVVPRDVPPVWAEVALEQARQAPDLFRGFLPGLAAEKAPELEADLRRAGDAAAEAVAAYAEFLEREVIPVAGGDFAAGREVFDEMLREDHMVDYDAEALLRTGRRLFEETEAEMTAVAAEIDPVKSVRALMEEAKRDHPTADGLLGAYRDAMEAARRYVVDHDIVTIPEGESLRIIETPVYARPVLPYAAYMPAGMLEAKQEGIFFVTPVEPGMTPRVKEEKLKGHHYAKLPVTALHEAYPGHHLQLVWANRQPTIPRRMGSFLSTLFIEGWAFYCEEMMEQLGYIAAPMQRLGRLSDQLWRAARIIIDVSLHTRGMTVDEAVDFLVDKCQLEPSNALAEVRRYTGSPTQPQSYLMGKLAILDLVKEYRRVHPAATLKQMHDAILACGSLPPRLMRERLFPH